MVSLVLDMINRRVLTKIGAIGTVIGNHCSGSMNDNTNVIKPQSGAPKYKYANYDAGYQSIPARICWFDGRPGGKYY